jgi:outer membrane protein TolC
MKMISRSGTIRSLLLLLLTYGGALAQPRALTLDEVLRMADEQSIDVRKARAALDRASLATRSARALSLPEVTAGADYFLNPQRDILFVAPGSSLNETGTTQAFPIGGHHSANLTLDIRQPLYDPLRRMERVIAESGVEVSKAELEVARALVRMNAEKAFYHALYARSEKEAREEQVKTVLANLDLALARFRGGRAMALDTLTANVTVARAKADAQRAGFNYLGSLLTLARILNLPDYENLTVEGRLEIPSAPGPSGGDMVASIGRLNSAELRLAQTERAAAETYATAQSYAAYPRLDAVGRVRGLGQGDEWLPSDMKFAMTSQVGLSAFYPISDLWRGNPKKEEAELRVQEAQLEIDRIRQSDSTRLDAILLNMRAARAQLLAEQAGVEQAQRAAEITMVLYKEGRATLTDVEQAQSRVLDARLAEQQVSLQFLDAYAELKAVIGDL